MSKLSKSKLIILGSGELGKEFVIESQRLGCEIIAVDNYPGAPAMQVADYSYVINMSDKDSLVKLILELKPDYVIPEIEAISIEALQELEDIGIKIVPNARAVEMTMNRDKIRDLASNVLNIRTANFKYVFKSNDLIKEGSKIGYPLVLKPLMSSSGKGQNLVNEEEDLLNAWSYALDNSRGNIKGVILEEFICFDYEFTLLSIRTSSKENIYCLPIGHEQFKGDYQSSWHPMEISERILNEAQDIANKLLDNLDGAGLYGVEFFVKNNTLIFSELSPRPHDTGMVTILSQNLNEFELHLRAILDIPIPKIKILKPAASRVILSKGDYKEFYFVNLDEALKIEDTKVLIFGKPSARKGRRMGVALASAKDICTARSKADECASHLDIIAL